MLSAEEEAIVIAFRKYTLLPLDDCLYALQAPIPHLTRSSLHRCLQRHGISRLPAIAGDKPARRPFKQYPIGYFHVDIAEVRTEEVAVDRTSKFAFAQLSGSAIVKTASTFLEALIKAIPYKIHTVLTDNGVQFCDMPKHRSGPTARYRLHGFDRICREQDIEHRLTKPNHPWTNGQVERMNRTLEDATVRRYHYDTRRQLEEHLAAFLDVYNFAKRMAALRGYVTNHVRSGRKTGCKPLRHSAFTLPGDTRSTAAIWSFASPKCFVIRCPLANDCFACSSVAQR